MLNELLIRYSSKSVPESIYSSALNVAEQIACDSNGGEESEVLLSSEITRIRRLTSKSAAAAFGNAINAETAVYRVDWVVWVCRARFQISDPWKVTQRQEHLYITEEELVNSDFTNNGFGISGEFLDWVQDEHTDFDASNSEDVPPDVASQVADMVADWGYKVAEWFGTDEPISTRHPLLAKMRPSFRKSVVSVLKQHR